MHKCIIYKKRHFSEYVRHKIAHLTKDYFHIDYFVCILDQFSSVQSQFECYKLKTLDEYELKKKLY